MTGFIFIFSNDADAMEWSKAQQQIVLHDKTTPGRYSKSFVVRNETEHLGAALRNCVDLAIHSVKKALAKVPT